MKTSINLNHTPILLTGAAGFIGYHLALRLLRECEGSTIIGLDNMSDYTPVSLKEWRLAELESAARESRSEWVFIKADIADKEAVDEVFAKYRPRIVVNFAAQAGVRYSIENPYSYLSSNITGFLNILEACRHSYDGTGGERDDRHSYDGTDDGEARDNAESNGSTNSDDTYHGVEHLVYASSSSVYGGNKKVPFAIEDNVDHPVSLYAASKKTDELMAHAYAKLYDIPCTGLRFFTVYGPAGRTDMAYFGFTETLLSGGTIKIFNYGDCKRDFTYVSDITEGIYRVMMGAPARARGEDGLPIPPYSLYNIGGGRPENLLDFVQILQEELVRAGLLPEDYDFEAHRELVPMQPGDVPVTYADSSALERDFGFTPQTDLRTGLRRFAEWYREYKK